MMDDPAVHVGDAAETFRRASATGARDGAMNRALFGAGRVLPASSVEPVQLGWLGMDRKPITLPPGSMTILGGANDSAYEVTLNWNTLFALDCALQVAIEQKRSTIYVSTKLPPVRIASHLISSITRIPLRQLAAGVKRVTDAARVSDAIELLKKSPLRILDVCGFPFEQVGHLLNNCKDWCPEAEEVDAPQLVIVDTFDDLFLGDPAAQSRLTGISREAAETMRMLEELRESANSMDAAMLLLVGFRSNETFLRRENEGYENLPQFRLMRRFADMFMVLAQGCWCERHFEKLGFHLDYFAGRSSYRQGYGTQLLHYDRETCRFRDLIDRKKVARRGARQ